ncbi:MAG TPA: hypothetical protein VE093_28345 [Polyangiaceae bacterium]|nr:hypothetical protein [Polyangiaceae bacterium]
MLNENTSLSDIGVMSPCTFEPTLTALKEFALPNVLLGSISQLASTWHVDEQQSPAVTLPSSHISTDSLIPSPQTGAHALGEPLHAYPVSTMHVELQPSPPESSPSSHVSAPISIPSPQTDKHMLGAEPLQA